MFAIIQHGYGGPETLAVGEAPRPTATEGTVVIATKAAAIDRGTWHLMTGRPWLMRPVVGFRTPRQPIPGRDVAGVIVEVGPGVPDLQVGDEVLGTAAGALAEYARLPLTRLVRKPPALDFTHAAALPVSGVTALDAVQKHGKLRPGERVLITGASGGVGSYAVQLARAAGASVTGVCSGAKAEFVRQLGATEVVVYGPGPLAAEGPFDLIIDIAGRRPVAELRRLLTTGGRAVIVGGEGGDPLLNGMGRQLWAALTNLGSSTKVSSMLAGEQAESMATLVDLVVRGEVTPAIDRVLPLDDAAAALSLLERGEVCGKLVLTA